MPDGGENRPHILVIKLGALGDFVQALEPCAAIRKHHQDALITLLTTQPFEELARQSGYFDEIWLDERPKLLQVLGWLDLRKRLKAGDFSRVYDLQTSDRSGFYFKLFGPGKKPEWSGIAKGCSHPHANPMRDNMHTYERLSEQLEMTGITDVPTSDLSWVSAETAMFNMPKNYALLVPGGAPHRPEKRWPSRVYGELAARLLEKKIQPVLLGTSSENKVINEVMAQCPNAVNLIDNTSFSQIVALAKQAQFSIGNDTGPMHLIAVAGCRSVALYSHASDPELCAQRGRDVQILRRERLQELTVDEVLSKAIK
jgi:ADP-heptose:LPS heptosyltransferase